MNVTLTDEKRRARIQHSCRMCMRTIDPGEIYRHVSYVYDGRITMWKECAHCTSAVRSLDLWAMADGDEGIGPSDFEAFEPETIAQARVLIGWRGQWRRKDGSLREVPDAG